MTIKDDYCRYLDHFGSTMTVRDLHRQAELADATALRHDIDHDLDLALEMAHLEHARGIRATYYLLHTHSYWNDPQFHLKCAQLQSYGHEVGLHLNVLVQWMNRECEDIEQSLAAALAYLRQADIAVDGVSAHGDQACYRHQVINYWMFRELRSTDPSTSEQRRSAEGVVVDDPRWQVTYPADDRLLRDDGRTQPLWSVSMAKHGLAYDAMHVPVDHYWTDSGGTWLRSGDPLRENLRRGRHQVLMHPIWWRGPQKTVFVLSTARAGSTWLANFVDRATSCKGLHEWTLNHCRRGDDVIDDKRTGEDYVGLLRNFSETAHLIRDALATFKIEKRDVLEANVYLEPLLDQLQKASPGAVFVHLHRDARDVVRSILNRGWYAAPIDYRHREADTPLWPMLNRFERACWYWRCTNERLWKAPSRISFERMVSDQAYLTRALKDLGIVVHPLLAAEEFPKRMNAGKVDDIPGHEHWSGSMRAAFEAICGPMQQLLGYQCDDSLALKYRPPRDSSRPFGSATAHTIDVLRQAKRPLGLHDVQLTEADEGLSIRLDAGAITGHVVLANGTWRELPRSCGIRVKPGTYLTGMIRADLLGEIDARLFVLCFDHEGRQVHKAQLATLRTARQGLRTPTEVANRDGRSREIPAQARTRSRFSFLPSPQTTHLSLAIVLDAANSSGPHELIVRSLTLESRRIEIKYQLAFRRPAMRR